MASRPSTIRKHFVRTWLDNGMRLTCVLCLKNIDSEDEITVDHLKPKSKKGSNRVDNLVPAHYTCNQLKKDTYETDSLV